MNMPPLQGDDYTIQYNLESRVITFEGELALCEFQDCQPIIDFLNHILESGLEKITLDVRGLHFLNVSGITMLSQFVMSCQSKTWLNLVILGNQEVFWQDKSLNKFQKLLSDLEIIW